MRWWSAYPLICEKVCSMIGEQKANMRENLAHSSRYYVPASLTESSRQPAYCLWIDWPKLAW